MKEFITIGKVLENCKSAIIYCGDYSSHETIECTYNIMDNKISAFDSDFSYYSEEEIFKPNSKALNESFKVLKKSIETLLENKYPKSKILGEPFMSKRGLYPTISKKNNVYISGKLLDFLQYSDGKNDLFSISKLIKLNMSETKNCFNILLKLNLIDS